MQKRRPDKALSAHDKALSANEYLRRVWTGVLSIAVVVVLFDQLTKSWAESHLGGTVIIHVLGSLQFSLTYNNGVAFGLGAGAAPYLVVIAVLAVLGYILSRPEQLRGAAIVAVGLVLGGALGNVFDRLFRGHGGAVVDFIDLQWWPIFNVADMCVVVGAILLVFVSTKTASKGPTEHE